MRFRVLVSLVALLGAAVFVSATLLAEGEKFTDPDDTIHLTDPDDPLHQRAVENATIVAMRARAVSEAVDHGLKTGDYTALLEAAKEYSEVGKRHEPSKLDMWEARQRLIDAIYESDDETVYSWYFLINESMQREQEMAKEVAEVLSKVDRIQQDLATEGVSLIPAPQR